MTRWESVRLVAAREITTRVRTRSFRVALLIAVAAVVAGIVLPKVFDQPDAPYDVLIDAGVTDPEVDAVRFAGTAVGRDIEVDSVTDAAAARRAIADGDADLALVDGTVLVRRIPAASDTSTFSRFLVAVGGSLRVYAGLYEQGLSPEDARLALSHPPPRVEGVLPSRPDRDTEKVVTMFGIIAIFVFVQQYGFWIVNGVVEEKSSRVIEVLLSVVRPGEMLIGKTLGIGVVALGHGLAIAVTAIVTMFATGGSLLDDGAAGTIAALIGWFFLAYALYCLLLAMAGALAAHQEDIQNSTFPVLAPLILAYVVSTTAVFAPEPSTFVRVLSFVPLTAPIAMPARMASESVPALEVALAVGGVLVAIVLAARVASVIYGRGVMHTSGRLRWRDVLARESAA